MRRAVASAASRRPPAAAPATTVARARPPAPADPDLAAEALRAEYLFYLERRVADGHRGVTELETYLLGLWRARFRRWVGGHLARRRS